MLAETWCRSLPGLRFDQHGRDAVGGDIQGLLGLGSGFAGDIAGGIEGQEQALVQPGAGRLQVGLERHQVAVHFDVLHAFGREDIVAAHHFAQAQAAAQLLVQPGLDGEIGLGIVGDHEHIGDRTARGPGQRGQVELGRGHLYARDGGDLRQILLRHPDPGRDAHQQGALDFGFCPFGHHDDICAQPVDRQAQAVFGAAHQQGGEQCEDRHQHGAQCHHPASEGIPGNILIGQLE